MSEIQSLTLEVRANSDKATRSLDALAASLNKLKGSATGSNLGKVASDLKQIRESGTRTSESTRQTSEGIEKTGQAAGHATGKLSALAASLKGVMSGTASLGAALKGVGSSLFKVASQAGTAAAKGIRGIVTAPFSVAAAGVRGIAAAFNTLKDKVSLSNTALGKLFSAVKRIAMYRLIRSAIKMVTEGVKEGIENLYKWSDAMNGSFAAAMDTGSAASLQFKNSIAAMLGPAIEAVIPLLVTLANVAIQAANAINMFISALFGRATWTRAKEVSAGATKSLKGAGKAAKDADDKIKGLLADWDELNIIQNESSKDPNGGSGGGGGGGISAEDMFENVPLGDNWWTDLGSRLREAIAAGDWEGAGNILAKKLNEVVDKIEPEKWAGKLRDTISKGISFAIGFLDEFDFKGFGRKFGRFLTEMFSANSEDMWDRIGTYLKLRFMGMINFAAGVFEDPTLFTGLGTSLATMLNSAFDLSGKDIDAIAEVFGGTFTKIAKGAVTLLRETDFAGIGEKINAILQKMFGPEGSIDGNALGEAINAAFIAAADFVNGLLGDEKSNVFSSVGETLAAALNRAFAFTGKEVDNLSQAFGGAITRAVRGVSAFITETDFTAIGETVKNFLIKTFGSEGTLDATAIGTALKDSVFAAINFVSGLLGDENQDVFQRLAQSASDFVNGAFDLSEEERSKIPATINRVVKSAIEGVGKFFDDTDWDRIGQDVRDAIEGIDWEGLISSLFQTGGKIMSAISKIGNYILLAIHNSIAEAINNNDIANFIFGHQDKFGDIGAYDQWIKTGNTKGLSLNDEGYLVSRAKREVEDAQGLAEAAAELGKTNQELLNDIAAGNISNIKVIADENTEAVHEETEAISDYKKAVSEGLDHVKGTFGSTASEDIEEIGNVADESTEKVNKFQEAVAKINEEKGIGETGFDLMEAWHLNIEAESEAIIKAIGDTNEAMESIPDVVKTPDGSGFVSFVNNIAEAAVNAAQTAINALSQLFSAAQAVGNISVTMRSGGGGGFDPYHYVRGYASGGVVTAGQMFIAREAGPEYVGTMGNHTAVANNEQIVTGIASGVASANAEQNALLRQQNSLLTQLLNKEFTAKAVPSSAWGRFQQQSADMYVRQTGRG